MRGFATIGCIAVLALTATAQRTTTHTPLAAHSTASSTDTGSLPSGTVIRMKLETGVSTAVNKVGDAFAGRVIEDVKLAGNTLIPVGSSISGTVTKVNEKRRYLGRPVLELRPEQVTLPNGDKYNIVAVLSSTDPETGTSVNDEGRIVGSGIDGGDKVKMIAGTAGGAAFGGLVARSGKGTVVGAMIGGGAAVGYWLSRRKSASIEAGSEIVMELSRPLSLSAIGD